MLWKCQKFCFWQNGGIFGKVFGSFWGGEFWGKEDRREGGISVDRGDLGSAKNRGGSAKNLVFGRMGIFLAGFLADA